ncbi:MAG: metal-sulfur cluster assembly factor [Patescibacteria group bacterium]
MPTKKDIEAVLKTIPDPEIGVSLWDLGLIYDIGIDLPASGSSRRQVQAGKKEGTVRILMTLTTIGCPLFDLIAGPIREEVGKLKGVKRVEVELTFEPPWSMDRMSEEAKAQLGF